MEILFVRHEQKDCNVKPDPQGNAQILNTKENEKLKNCFYGHARFCGVDFKNISRKQL